MANEFHLRTTYGQIIIGYTPAEILSRKGFIRHFSAIEQGVLDSEHADFYDDAVKKGLSTKEARLQWLKENDLWTEKQQAELEQKQTFVENLVKTKKNLPIQSQVEEINKQIAEEEKILQRLKTERAEHIGLTAEIYARKKMNERYMFHCLFKDKHFTERLFSDEEYDYFDIAEINNLTQDFNKAMSSFTDLNIKRIALSGFFQECFGLCEDNIFHFYGKPIVSLTFFQSNLASYGRVFKHLLQAEPKPPQDIISDPDKLIDWYNTNKNADKMMQSQNASNVAIMGANAQDMKILSEGRGSVVTIGEKTKGKTSVRGAEFRKLLG